MLHDLVGGIAVDQGRLADAIFQTITDFHGLDGGFQLFHESIVDAVLYQKAVNAHAGLASVAELAGHGAFHGLVQVGIVKDDKGRVAAQFQGHFLNVLGALGHQLGAHFGGPGKAQFAKNGRVSEGGGNGPGAAGNHIEHASGNARALGQLSQRQGGVGGGAGGFDHHGAAGCQSGPGLAGDHGRGEIPGGDGGGDADGLFDHHNPLARLGGRDGIAVGTPRLLGKPFQEGGGIGDFALRLGQGLALFQGHQSPQIILVFHHQVVPGLQ